MDTKHGPGFHGLPILDRVHGHFLFKEELKVEMINKHYDRLQPTKIVQKYGLEVLIIDIYTCLHDTFIQNDDDVCLQPGCMTLMVSVCSTLWIFFLFAVVFFPYTVKLTFVLDHAHLPFSFCYPRITSAA